MTPTTLASLLFLVIGTLAAAAEDTSRRGLFGINPKTHVIITNNLGAGEKLTIRCWSKDDNLGVHVIDVGAQYQFVFNPNILGTTLFLCDLSWAHGFVSFRAYDASRHDDDRCGKVCKWGATNAGVHGYTIGGTDDVVYKWQAPRHAPPAL